MAEDKRKVVIELQNVKRYFQVGSETVKALRGVSFKIYEGSLPSRAHPARASRPCSTSWDVLTRPPAANTFSTGFP